MSNNMQALYVRFCALASSMPDFTSDDLSSKEVQMWLGRAAVGIAELAQHPRDRVTAAADVEEFQSCCDQLWNELYQLDYANRLQTIFYRALARAESLAPTAMQGAFIAAGSSFDAIAAFSKVVTGARGDVMLVDPYADEKALTVYGVLVPESATLRILADGQLVKPSLKPAGEGWRRQWPTRPLEIRVSQPRLLHDRLIFLDRRDVWQLGQSLNHFVERAHSSIVRVDLETAKLKIDAYEAIWNASTVL